MSGALRDLADQIGERQEWFDVVGDEVVSDGFGPTTNAAVAWMRFRPHTAEALRLLADMGDFISRPCCMTDEPACPNCTDAGELLDRLAALSPTTGDV